MVPIEVLCIYLISLAVDPNTVFASSFVVLICILIFYGIPKLLKATFEWATGLSGLAVLIGVIGLVGAGIAFAVLLSQFYEIRLRSVETPDRISEIPALLNSTTLIVLPPSAFLSNSVVFGTRLMAALLQPPEYTLANHSLPVLVVCSCELRNCSDCREYWDKNATALTLYNDVANYDVAGDLLNTTFSSSVGLASVTDEEAWLDMYGEGAKDAARRTLAWVTSVTVLSAYLLFSCGLMCGE